MRVGGPLLVMAAFGCASVGAQTATVFNRTGSGARAAGMANAFIAVSDDGTAASWNPAGLGQLRMPELSVVSSTTGQALGSEGFRTRDDLSIYSPIHSTYTSTYLDFASLAVPVTIAHKPVTFQAAWRRLFTLDFRENASTTRSPLRPEGPPPLLIEGNSDVVGGFALLSMAGAVKLTSHLALGGSFNLWRGDWTETSTASETPLEGPGPSRFGMARSTNRARANNLSLGLMLTYPRWSIGLLRQGKARGDFTSVGTARRSHEPAPAESFGGKVVFPQALGLGVAWRPAPRWTVAFDLTWDDWSHTLLDLTDGPTIDLFNGLPPDRSATRDTVSANLARSASSMATATSSPSASGPPGSRRVHAIPTPATP